MHLRSLKIAGFKSFYQPTTLSFPSNRVVLVGPNGCGKSNIIDAIRWVLGESTASGLRSDSLNDILFNGTEDYSPVGRTSVELSFDNRQKRLDGKLAKHDHIKVKRVLERDQTSRYYINDKICRRKDIEELFTGLGLTGKADYAIITQGTIHSLVESKPEYIRLVVEEAAKITDYRHKRRETLVHIKNTKINLKQVSASLRDTKTRMTVLAKQAQDAQEFNNHQQELRKLKKQLVIVLYQDLERKQQLGNQELNSMVEALQNYKNEAAKLMIAQERLALKEKDGMALLKGFSTKQQELNNRLVVLETDQKHRNQRKTEKQQQLEVLQTQAEKNQEELLGEQEELSLLTTQLKQESEKTKRIIVRESLANLTDEHSKVDTGWQNFLAQINKKEVSKQELRVRLDKLQQEVSQLETAPPPPLPKTPPRSRLTKLTNKIARLKDSLNKIEQARDRIKTEVLTAEHRLHQIEQELTRINTLLGELSQSAKDLEPMKQLWIDNVSLPAKWERAMDLVAHRFKQARTSPNLPDEVEKIAKKQNFILVTNMPTNEETFNGLTSLGAMLKGKYIPSLFYHIYACPDLATALSLQPQLKNYQSLITPEAEWLGKNWLISNLDKEKSTELFTQKRRLSALLSEKEEIEKQKRTQLQQIKSLQQKHQGYSHQINKHTNELRDSELDLAKLKEEIAKAQEAENRQREILIAIRLKSQRKTEVDKEMVKVKAALKELLKDLQKQEKQKSYWQQRRTELHHRIQKLEQESAQMDMALSQSEREKLLTSIAKLEKSLADRQERHKQLMQQKEKLIRQESKEDLKQKTEQKNMAKLLRELDRLKTRISHQNKEIKNCNDEKGKLGNQLARLEKNIAVLERDISQRHSENEQLSLDISDMISRSKDLKEPPQQEITMDQRSLKERISQLERRIERSEGINQLALRDYQKCKAEYEQQEAQRIEVLQALRILEKSIRKMDRQSKKKFDMTFKKINDKFRLIFSQLSDGGRAYLEEELANEDPKGIRIIANPRGRRKTNLASLSGGEKTVVAIALIMAIFQLNPSPFCLMDEADAMLDDDNVLRFNKMITDMTANTQFILITHNKATVRNAEHLIGVTMAEPGSSQVVSVDMNKALELSLQVEAGA